MEWIEAQPGHAEIAPDEVHVWRFALTDPRCSVRMDALSADERARAEAMESNKARQSFVASQSALRHILSGYLDTSPESLEFARGAHGKPRLSAAGSYLEFNVSHSGDWGLVAVARCDVGVDVEQVREQRASLRMQERFLTTGERELLARHARSNGDAAFFIVWSRKEAYLKAAGFGLAAPFSRVDSSGDRLPDLDDNGGQLDGDTPWTVHEFFVDRRHPATVVARAPQISLHRLTLHTPDR